MLYRKLGVIFIGIAIVLVAINVWGLFKTLAPEGITVANLRFGDRDASITEQQFWELSVPKVDETSEEYADRLNKLISTRLAHLHWGRYPEAKFNQRVPFWENYILFLMGMVSGIPEYERYHFSSPEKSIERGIGICGDASMVMSQLLERNRVPNKIITMEGHVMVEAEFSSKKVLYDPDFGVKMPFGVQYYVQNPDAIVLEYGRAGYAPGDGVNVVLNGLSGDIGFWDGVEHFITKKHYFEKLSYILIWCIPCLLLISGLGLIHFGKRKH